MALSLRNRDAGDSDARHRADGHLEQQIWELKGLAIPACQRSRGMYAVRFPMGMNRQVGFRGNPIRQQEFHCGDGIFVDRWRSRIVVDVVFGVFSKRSAQKVENGIDTPQPEISLEGVFPSDVPRADVEGDIVEVPFLRFVDQSAPFFGEERVGLIVGAESSSQDLFVNGVGVVFLAVGNEMLFL